MRTIASSFKCISILLLLMILVTGCDKKKKRSSPVEPERVATTLEISPTGSLRLNAGAFADLSARVLDQYGAAMNASVSWSLNNPQAVSLSAASTSSGGTLRITGTQAGSATLTGGSGAANASIELIVLGPPAKLIAAANAQNQSGPVNTPVPVRPSVAVTDVNDRPLSGISVTFVVQSGGGAVTGATQVSDQSGIATVESWSLGAAPGTNTLLAQVAGIPPVTFSAIATPRPSGVLQVDIRGLPDGVPADVTVSGPNGYAADVSTNTTLSSLPSGSYTISARAVTANGVAHTPAPTSQIRSVQAGATTTASVVYTAAGTDLNFTVDGALVFQTVQTSQGTVPLMAGKPAIVRVWVRGNRPNSHQIPVRLRIYRSGQIVHEEVRLGPPAVPTQYTMGDGSASWQFFVPADKVQPGSAMLVHADPNGSVAESTEEDNAFPRTGAGTLGIFTLPGFSVRFLQICLAYAPACGRYVNEDEMLRTTYTVHPVWTRQIIPAYQVTTGRDVTTTAGWSALLQDLEAQRVLDGFGGTPTHYVGIVTTPPQVTLQGLAFIGGFSALFNNDNPASGPTTLAHELGHNFNRRHSPCGGASDVDPNYPFSDGSVGAYGVNLFTGEITSPAYKDIMSYCPPLMTASAFTYNGVFAARQGPFPSSAPAEPVVVLAGRRVGGTLTLDPVFTAVTRPTRADRNGRFTVEGLDAAGRVIFSHRVEPLEVADLPGGAEIFVAAVPVSADRRSRLTEVRVSDGTRRASQLSTGAARAAGPSSLDDEAGRLEVRLSRSGDQVGVEWDAGNYPALLIREAGGGRLLAILHGGRGAVVSPQNVFDIQASDGVQTIQQTVRVRR